MILSFHPCFLGDTLIILGDGTLDAHDLRLIEAAEIIILPQYCTPELYRTCKRSSAQIFPNYDARFKYPGKIGQNLLFKNYGCPHPKTLLWASVKVFREAYEREEDFSHRMPFLIKGDQAHEAEGIYMITDTQALDRALEDMARLEASGFPGFISQELIRSEGNVLRAVIVGSRIITYWKRAREAEQIIITISRGAEIDKAWKPELQTKGKREAERLAAATGINLAAIDFIFDFRSPDPEPLLLEINYVFGRRGLGGSMQFYRFLTEAVQEWLVGRGFDPRSVTFL